MVACGSAARRIVTLLVLAVAACGPADDAAYPSPDAVEPLAVGSPAPSASITDIDGQPLELAAVLRNRGVLLVFYRGGW